MGPDAWGPQPWGSSALPVCYPHPEAVRGRERAALAHVESRAQAPSCHTAAWAEPRPWDRPPPCVPLFAAPRPERAWLGEGQHQPVRDRVSQGSHPAGRPAGHSQAATAVHCRYNPNPGPHYSLPGQEATILIGGPAAPLPSPLPGPSVLRAASAPRLCRRRLGSHCPGRSASRYTPPAPPCGVSLTRKAHLPPALPPRLWPQ